MHYMFITTTTWIEIFICSMNNFLYNIIVNISTLRINSNSNTYLKFSFHTLFFFKLNWIIVPRQFSSDEFLDAAFWNVRKTTILFILKANLCHPLFTKSERLFLKKTHSWSILSAAIQAMHILPISYNGNTLRIYTCKYHLICKVYNLQP